MSFIDLQRSLKDWPYHADRISVRKIRTEDGEIKIQQRVEMGIVQMEAQGRPDGQRPFGCDSLLRHHQKQLGEYEQRNGAAVGFALTPQECQALREEASLYYRRYVANFVLEEYDRVAQDTAHNLAILDLLRDHGQDGDDRAKMEGFRPYVVMMYSRACAQQALREGEINSALAHVNRGLINLRQHFDEAGAPEAFDTSEEVKILRDMRARLASDTSPSPQAQTQQMKAALQMALEAERYEEAARLRDELRQLGEDA